MRPQQPARRQPEGTAMSFFRRSTAKTLSPDEVARKLDAGEITLVDVREASEWAAGHIAGAVHIPLSRFSAEAGGIPGDKPVVLYCLSGARSGQAIAFCQAKGLGIDTHMAGGISMWAAHRLPIVRS